MATIVSHFLVGWGVYRFAEGRQRGGLLGPVIAGTLAVLPDADVLSFAWRVAYSDPWGHRGMTHSLAFAAVLGTVVAALHVARLKFPHGLVGLAATFAVAMASHGLLDAATDGGMGVAFFAPFADTRYFLPIRPIPVSPIGVSSRVVGVLLWETILLWPWAVLLTVVRAPTRRWMRWSVVIACVASAAVWITRAAGYRVL